MYMDNENAMRAGNLERHRDNVEVFNTSPLLHQEKEPKITDGPVEDDRRGEGLAPCRESRKLEVRLGTASEQKFTKIAFAENGQDKDVKSKIGETYKYRPGRDIYHAAARNHGNQRNARKGK